MSDELRDQITDIFDEYSIHAAVSLDYIAELIVCSLAEAALTADPLDDPLVVAMVEALRMAQAALSDENVNMSVVKREVNAALTEVLDAYKARFIDQIEDDT